MTEYMRVVVVNMLPSCRHHPHSHSLVFALGVLLSLLSLVVSFPKTVIINLYLSPDLFIIGRASGIKRKKIAGNLRGGRGFGVSWVRFCLFGLQ